MFPFPSRKSLLVLGAMVLLAMALSAGVILAQGGDGPTKLSVAPGQTLAIEVNVAGYEVQWDVTDVPTDTAIPAVVSDVPSEGGKLYPLADGGFLAVIRFPAPSP